MYRAAANLASKARAASASASGGQIGSRLGWSRNYATKDIELGVEARALMLRLRGVEELADAVKVTMGPRASDIEELRRKLAQLRESKSQLETRNPKLAEESTYANGRASAAGVLLKRLAKLMKENERLATELASLRNSPSNGPKAIRRDGQIRRQEPAAVRREVNASNRERELLLEAALKEKEQREMGTPEESRGVQTERSLSRERASQHVGPCCEAKEVSRK